MRDDFFKQLTFFQAIPNFDAQSRNGGTCSISSLNRQDPQLGRPANEVDEFILRGPFIDYEGFIDIRPSVIIRTAEELGMVSAERLKTAMTALYDSEEARIAAQAEAAAYQQELDSLRAAIRNTFADGQTRPSEDVLDTNYTELPEDL